MRCPEGVFKQHNIGFDGKWDTHFQKFGFYSDRNIVCHASSQSKKIFSDSYLHKNKSDIQRCQLTVMFCDLVGSTALSERLDPEDLLQILWAYQEACTAVIELFFGYIAQYLGDGILVYFGYPTCLEDDPQRAVQAGLDILSAIEQLNDRLIPETGIQLAVRIGIHTDEVVMAEVGAGKKHELLAVGETPNIAARVQNLAMGNSVAISGVTHQLVREAFNCECLGECRLKGISHPVEVYRVN